MARNATTKRKGRRSRAGLGTVLAIVGLVAMAAVAAPLCVLFAAGMLPTVVAAMVDRHPRRHLARAVAAANLAGMVWPVMGLLHYNFTLAGALYVLGDSRNWLVMYGGAGIGWLLHGALPPVARIIIDIRARAAERRLTADAATLAEEWGEGVRGATPAHPPK